MSCNIVNTAVEKAKSKIKANEPGITKVALDKQLKAVRKLFEEVVSKNVANGGNQGKKFQSESNDSVGSSGEAKYQKVNIVAKEFISDPSTAKGILAELLVIDKDMVTDEHRKMLESSLADVVDQNSAVIPDMVQRIVVGTRIVKPGVDTVMRTEGKVVMTEDGKPVVLEVKVAKKPGKRSHLDMSGAEVYVHEMTHASIEFARRVDPSGAATVMSNVREIYEDFMEVVKEEDFMPKDSMDKERDRILAKKRIDSMAGGLDGTNTDGISEFMARVKSDITVRDIVAERVKVKAKEYDTSTGVKKVIAAIRRLVDITINFLRKKEIGLDGYSAMVEYIAELNKINNQAAAEIGLAKRARNAASELVDVLDKKGAKLVQALGGKFKGLVKDGDVKLPDGKKYTDLGKIEKLGIAVKVIGHAMARPKESRFQFEALMELFGFKPEGSVQQLLMQVRSSDDFETQVEMIGKRSEEVSRQSNKFDYKAAELVNHGFKDGKPTKEQSYAITKTILETGVEGMEMTAVEIAELLGDSEGREARLSKLIEEHRTTLGKLVGIVGGEPYYNYLVNQTIGLGRYMATGVGGLMQNVNARAIVGRYHINGTLLSMKARPKKGIEDDDFGYEGYEDKVKLVDKLATLEALKLVPKETVDELVKFAKNDPEGIDNVLNLARGVDAQEADAYGDGLYYDFYKVKGRYNKNEASYIDIKIDKSDKKEEYEKDGYSVVENSETADGLEMYVNRNNVEEQFNWEGVRSTNVGRRVESYLDIVKTEVTSTVDQYGNTIPQSGATFTYEESIAETTEILKDMSAKVDLELERQESGIVEPDSSGLMPVYRVGRNGTIVLTDFDVTYNKNIKEVELESKNDVGSVIGKAIGRSVDIHLSQDVNKDQIELAFEEMEKNYLGHEHDEYKQGDYYAGGKNNAIFVKIGPEENNELSKEVWPVLAKNVKLNIFRGHEKYRRKKLIKLGKQFADAIETTAMAKTRGMIESGDYSNEETVILYKTLEENLVSAVKGYVAKFPNSGAGKRAKQIMEEKPMVAIRRNMVYHHFGRRDPSLIDFKMTKWVGKGIKEVKALNKIAGISKAIIKKIGSVFKFDVVLRNIPTIRGNAISNVVLGVVRGNSMQAELADQMKGVRELIEYMDEENALISSKIKLAGELDKVAKAKLQREVRKSTQKLESNTVSQMIKSGMYTLAFEDLTDSDLYKTGYIDAKIDKLAGKLPDKVMDVVNLAFVTNKTQLLKALIIINTYGDFAARYAKLMKLRRDGVPDKKAMKIALDNQINYNWDLGKGLDYMDKVINMIRFVKYFVGNNRVMAQAVTETPFSVMMGAFAAGMVDGNDNPINHTILTKDLGNMVYTPMDTIRTVTDSPEMYRVITGNYNY